MAVPNYQTSLLPLVEVQEYRRFIIQYFIIWQLNVEIWRWQHWSRLAWLAAPQAVRTSHWSGQPLRGCRLAF